MPIMWLTLLACGQPASSPDDTAVTLPDTASTPASTADVEVCGPTPFRDQVARIHTCPQPCDGAIEACSWDSTADTGWPSRSVYVVAAGRGAVIRYSGPGAATLLVHNGGTGTTYGPRRLPDAFVSAGGRVVEVVWHAASATGGNCADADCGWMTRPLDDQPSGITEVAARPAAVMQWVHDVLSDGGAFGTVSCSAGSLATFYARYAYELDPVLDYQMLLGGPLLHRASWGCSGRTTGCDGAECGRCRTDPSILCEVGGPASQCAGAGGTCASYRLTGSIGLLDVLYRNDASCPDVAGTDFAAGDMATEAGDTHLEHPVDIMVSTNLPAQLGDDDLGIVPHVHDVVEALTGPAVSLSDVAGPHCGTFDAPDTCEQVLSQMGFGATAATDCADR